MFETIVALATAPLKSALAIVRLSGDDCFDVVNKFFSKKINFKENEKNKIYHGYILNNNEKVDEVVLLAYKNPFSFTGEDSVEIISHGSPLIYNEIIEIALKNGARMATNGEYSSRSFMHNKLDLIQAESINDLINAETKEARDIIMQSLDGSTSSLITPLKKDFGDLLSLIEVNIDYPEYLDIEVANKEKITNVLIKNKEYITSLINNANKSKLIRNGINVVILGRPNVGKSSLLNALINEDKAIVTDIKGTTRDIVEAKFNLNGLLINLYDTAGIHESNDFIENIGIKKSKDKINEADLIICLFDSINFNDEDKEILSLIKNKNHIICINKKDLLSNNELNNNDYVYISALNKDIDSLKERILINLGLKDTNIKNVSISNTREIGILESINSLIDSTLIDLNNDLSLDLISININSIYLKILELTGEDHDFDIAKEIFSRFCVGK